MEAATKRKEAEELANLRRAMKELQKETANALHALRRGFRQQRSRPRTAAPCGVTNRNVRGGRQYVQTRRLVNPSSGAILNPLSPLVYEPPSPYILPTNTLPSRTLQNKLKRSLSSRRRSSTANPKKWETIPLADPYHTLLAIHPFVMSEEFLNANDEVKRYVKRWFDRDVRPFYQQGKLRSSNQNRNMFTNTAVRLQLTVPNRREIRPLSA